MLITIKFESKGEYNFANVQLEGSFEEIRGSIRDSKKGGVFLDIGHSRKSGDIYYKQNRVSKDLQELLDAATNKYFGNVDKIVLNWHKIVVTNDNSVDVVDATEIGCSGVKFNDENFAHLQNKEAPKLKQTVIENPEVLNGDIEEAFN